MVEFGVFKGNSIRWLPRRYPAARIVGADILPVQPEWPIDPRVEYALVDPLRDDEVEALLNRLPPPALIIEDGSHIPSHQWRCFRCGSDTFDYHHYKCLCGEPVLAEADSMTIVVRKRA